MPEWLSFYVIHMHAHMHTYFSMFIFFQDSSKNLGQRIVFKDDTSDDDDDNEMSKDDVSCL